MTLMLPRNDTFSGSILVIRTKRPTITTTKAVINPAGTNVATSDHESGRLFCCDNITSVFFTSYNDVAQVMAKVSCIIIDLIVN